MLVINNIEVKSNEDGLFSLADLWRSTGNNKNKKPSKWLSLKGTIGKIDYLCLDRKRALSNQQVISKSVHNYTYVCKELVYSYAMWINDEYHFKVIHAFDALVVGEFATALKIASSSSYINKAGDEFDRLTKDDQAVGEKAMNDFCNASGIYNTYSCKAGEDLASCRGKKKKRSDAEKAITERSQLSLTI